MFSLAPKATLIFTFLYLVATAVSAPIPSLARRTQFNRLAARAEVINLDQVTLQLPDDTSKSPEELKASFKNQWYIPESDSIIMKVPGAPSSGLCKTTPNSEHCRCEFEEKTSGWGPAGTNTMTVTLSAEPDEVHTCVGQIHMASSESTKPVIELYYARDGTLTAGIEQGEDGGQKTVTIGKAADNGQKFTYILDFSKGKLSLTLNGELHDLTEHLPFSPKLNYFKVGNYNQGTQPSTVTLYSAVFKH